MDARALDILKVFGLDGKSGYTAANLPYGQQRKLEIARALATSPKLLLLDEPAAGMNPQETGELMETIQLVREKYGVTILLIEHDMKLVAGIPLCTEFWAGACAGHACRGAAQPGGCDGIPGRIKEGQNDGNAGSQGLKCILRHDTRH